MFWFQNGQYFTKVDLNAAFHQLELDEQSRYITVFQTEDRIKRFKRLIFGPDSASEQLQHHLQTFPTDISGVINIADDILVFALTIAEHDSILQKVFQRLSKKGLTLNLECLFFKKILLLVLFLKNGMKPSVSKILALKEAKRPQDIKRISSYIGIINYLKGFKSGFSMLIYTIRTLIHQDIKFQWSDDYEKSFQS